MAEERKYNIGSFMCGAAIGIGAVVGYYWARDSGKLPNTDVQQGYVRPAELEVMVRDLSCDGKNYPIVRYKGKAYLLKEGEDTRPTLVQYSITEERR